MVSPSRRIASVVVSFLLMPTTLPSVADSDGAFFETASFMMIERLAVMCGVTLSCSTADKLTTTFVDAVLQLKVTPHITANRSIIMKHAVSKNPPSLSATDGSVVGINKNETTTEAILRDGETMVLGGIYTVDSGRTQSKVPFLADIPILGSAFKNLQLHDERKELLVFVTPRVVQGVQPDVE